MRDNGLQIRLELFQRNRLARPRCVRKPGIISTKEDEEEAQFRLRWRRDDSWQDFERLVGVVAAEPAVYNVEAADESCIESISSHGCI